jgi:hypothetical protein
MLKISGKRASVLAIIFNTATFGIFTPFMVSILKKKNRGFTFFYINVVVLVVLGSTSTSQTPSQPDSSTSSDWANVVIAFVLWSALLIAAFRIKAKVDIPQEPRETVESATEIVEVVEKQVEPQMPPKALKLPKAPKVKPLPKSAETSSAVKSANSFFESAQSFLQYYFSTYWKLRKLHKEITAREFFLGQVSQARTAFDELVKSLNLTPSVAKSENEILSVSGCILSEPRKGARVTERSSTSSGRGYAGVRVGRVYVGGSSSSTSQSRSVSYPAPDIMQEVDSGRFVLTTHRASFAGSMFTKSTEFKKMIDFNSDADSVLIAPRTGTKVWVVRFPSVEYSWAIRAILNAIVDSDSQIYDDSATKYGPTIGDFIQSEFRTKFFEIDELLKEEKAGISDLKKQTEALESSR